MSEIIKIDKDRVLHMQFELMYNIRHYENAYREAKNNNDDFYMKSHRATINRCQAKFDALQWVLTDCEIREEN